MSSTTYSVPTPRLIVNFDVTALKDDERREFMERTADLLAEYDAAEEEPVVQGWTRASIEEALRLLERNNGWEQAKAIREGLTRSDGRISRQDYYAITGRSEDLSLKGVTRPVTRIMKRMKAGGALAVEAVELLQLHYFGNQVDYVDVPVQLQELFTDAE